MTEANFNKITEALENGKDIQFCFYAGRYILKAKTYARWKAAGRPAIKRADNGIWLARGKGYDYAPDGTYTVYTY